MPSAMRICRAIVAVMSMALSVALLSPDTALAQTPQSKFAEVNGVKLHGFAKTRLQMPMLVLSGEKAGGPFLIEQGKMVAVNVEGVLVRDRGHWLMEEAPNQVIPKLVEFLNR